MVQRDGLPDFGFPLTAQENFLIKPQTLQELWQGPQRVFVLVDECAPEDYLKDAVTAADHGWQAFNCQQSFFGRPSLAPSRNTLNIRKRFLSAQGG